MDKSTPTPIVPAASTASPVSSALVLPNPEVIKSKWQTYTAEAAVLWDKLTDEELLQTGGQWQKLVGLVQQRYATTRDAAEKQVRDFLNKHQ